MARAKAVLTAPLFAARAGQGCPAPDPIFVLGLPRSGSTLVEQILASHSAVEGTMELPDIGAIAKRLGGAKTSREASAYPEILDRPCDPDDLEALGAGVPRPHAGCSARPTGRCSSTRCPTTGPTSA